MAKIVKVVKVLRNNWKKTIFFSSVAAYGVNYLKTRYETECLMRDYCKEALEYGNSLLPLGETNRHVTVLLNPAANGGKGKNMFEKYCAPLLHLAGLKVAIVRTEHEGQAKSLMEIMDNTSAVIVAGGDGTLAEVITGLMRREDSHIAARKFPVGVLPLGEHNSTAKVLWASDTISPKVLADSTMAIVRQTLRPLDIVRITPQVEEDLAEDGPSSELVVNQSSDDKKEEEEDDKKKKKKDGEKSKTGTKCVYASAGLEWGAFKDAFERRDAYWYYGPLKKYITFIFSSYKDLNWNCGVKLDTTQPCAGCSKCWQKNQSLLQVEEKSEAPNLRWWQSFLRSFTVKPRNHSQQITEEVEPEIDYSSVDNPDCGVVSSEELSASELNVWTRNSPLASHLPRHSLLLTSYRGDLSAFGFMREGWKRTWTNLPSQDTCREVGSISITPLAPTVNKKGEEREFYIDNEGFEIRPMTIDVVPKAIQVFALPERTGVKEIAQPA